MSPGAQLYSLRSRSHTSLPSFLQAGSWARATRTATDKPKPPRTNRERGHTGTVGAEAELEQAHSFVKFHFGLQYLCACAARWPALHSYMEASELHSTSVCSRGR